jgi:indole-3-acetate monooxygenase
MRDLEARDSTRATTIDWPARARALAPRIAQAADDIERNRVLPSALLDALHDAQMFRILLPRSFGGGEAEPSSFAAAIEELAKADASVAWCVGQAGGCSFSAAYLEPSIAREIFGDPRSVLAWGPGSHHSRAVAAPGGYKVTGSWSYASGSRHATWLGAHCAVFESDGTPRLSASGRQLEKTMLFPRSAASIEDVWQVVGLRGTGSDNYGLTDHFIPEGFTYERDSDRERRENGPLYQLGILSTYGMAFASVALGVARSALESFLQLAADKIPRTGGKVLRENAVAQAQAGLSEAKLRAARAFLHQSLNDMWATLSQGGKLSLDQRVGLRLAATFAIRQAREVVDDAYTAAGASAIFERNSFERRFRDIHTVSQQIQGHAANFETVGQVLLGLGGPNPRI